MLDRLTLHLGHPKTGTSSIQATFHASAAVLARHGLAYYAGYRNHHPIARTFAGDARPQDGAITAAFRRAMERARQPHGLVSSEVFTRFTEADVARVLTALRPLAGRIDAVLYVRHPVAFASSAAHQGIRAGSRIAEIAASPRVLPLRSIAERWERALGEGNLLVRPFARPVLVGGDVVDDLLAALGRSAASADLTRRNVNEGLSALGAVLVERALDHAPGRRLAKAALRPFDAIGGPRFVLPAATLDAVRRRTAPDLVWLAARYGVVLPEPDEVSTPAPQLSAAELDTLAETLYRLSTHVWRADIDPFAVRSEFWRDGDQVRSRLSAVLDRLGRRRREPEDEPRSERDKRRGGGAGAGKRR